MSFLYEGSESGTETYVNSGSAVKKRVVNNSMADYVPLLCKMVPCQVAELHSCAVLQYRIMNNP